MASSLLSGQASSQPEVPQAEHARVLRRAARQFVRRNRLVGLAYGAVVDTESHHGAVGTGNLLHSWPLTPRTRFYIGSVSKPFIAVAILQLRDAGRLQLGDSVRAHLPEAEIDSVVTIEHLLTHSSGLPREGTFEYWFTGDFPGPAALLAAPGALDFVPGSSWQYSNVGYAILGQIIERITEQSLGEYLREHLFQPLEMTQSGVGRPRHRLAMGYSPRDRVLPSPAHPFAGLARRVGQRRERMYHGPRAMAPAFGLHSTARDLTKFVYFLLHGGSILNDSSRGEMLQAQHATNDPGVAWGYGIRVSERAGQPSLRHDGWFAAHRSHLSIFPQQGLGVVALINADDLAPHRAGEVLADALTAD